MTPINKEEKPIDYFYRLLTNGELDFTDLLNVYVKFLENQRLENRVDIVDSALTIAMYKTPKLNQGTQKQLDDEADRLIKKSGIFPERQLNGSYGIN